MVEGVDEGAGIIGTVHSFRYFDSHLFVVTTTDNGSGVEGYVHLDDYVSDGHQFSNVFVTPARPAVTLASLEVFENVPDSGGTLHGSIVADGITVTEFELTVPARGSPQPDVPVAATAAP